MDTHTHTHGRGITLSLGCWCGLHLRWLTNVRIAKYTALCRFWLYVTQVKGHFLRLFLDLLNLVGWLWATQLQGPSPSRLKHSELLLVLGRPLKSLQLSPWLRCKSVKLSTHWRWSSAACVSQPCDNASVQVHVFVGPVDALEEIWSFHQASALQTLNAVVPSDQVFAWRTESRMQ